MVYIPINKAITPVAQPYRRLSIPLEKEVEDKLKELLQQDIIERVNEPCNWISPMVVRREDKLRICIDMRRANEAISREKHPLPTMDDFLHNFNGCRIFSRLDIKQAFHQIEVAEECRYITTFITKIGLMRYKRLMFGITCAPEIFQKTMEKIFAGIDGVMFYIDDIIIYAKDVEEHDKRLANVMKRINDYNILLNTDKCIYKVSELEFLGHHLSKEGVKISKSRIAAMELMSAPKTTVAVKSVMGLITFCAKFIPELATLTYPLRILLKKGQEFYWGEEQNKAFQQIKQILAKEETLGYFNVNDKTSVIADASPVGLGAVLIQEGINGTKIICYASKSLSDPEKRYCQTEKEALALVWAVERFHFYLYGKQFDLITDHKPLEVIFGPHSRPCARIERWVLRLQSYDFKVVYKPGNTNIADPLSRWCQNDAVDESFDEQSDHYVSLVAEDSRPIAIEMNNIIKHAMEDPEFLLIKKALKSGNWPKELSLYRLIQSELCISGELILRGHRMIIPEKLQLKTLQLAHEGHPGQVLMKRRLRTKVWWKNIDKMVEQFVNNCNGCVLTSTPGPPLPMVRTELPIDFFVEVAVDFLGPLPSGDSLFVLVDYYSRWPEVIPMKETSTETMIKSLDNIFTHFGYPQIIRCDNGPQFRSEKFKNYCLVNGIKINHVTPYAPFQNGEVERMNRGILKRARISQSLNLDWEDELNKYLLMCRTTPHSTTGESPSMMLFNKNIRDKIPSLNNSIIRDDEETRDKDLMLKEKGKEYTDRRRNAKPNNINVGDQVFVKNMAKDNKLSTNFRPEPHTVTDRRQSDVIVRNQDTGKEYRRHVSHLKRLHENSSTISSEQSTINPSDLLSTNQLDQPTDQSSIHSSDQPSIHSSDQSTYIPLDQTIDVAVSDTRNHPNEVGRPKRIHRAPLRFKDYV